MFWNSMIDGVLSLSDWKLLLACVGFALVASLSGLTVISYQLKRQLTILSPSVVALNYLNMLVWSLLLVWIIAATLPAIVGADVSALSLLDLFPQAFKAIGIGVLIVLGLYIIPFFRSVAGIFAYVVGIQLLGVAVEQSLISAETPSALVYPGFLLSVAYFALIQFVMFVAPFIYYYTARCFREMDELLVWLEKYSKIKDDWGVATLLSVMVGHLLGLLGLFMYGHYLGASLQV